jgi:ParB family chromosome partitioning protein
VSRALALLKLPEDVQRRVDAGELAARTAYELSKLGDPARVARLASQAAAERLTHDEVAKRVRQQRGRRAQPTRGVRLAFPGERGWRVVVTRSGPGSYEEVEHALAAALEEVRCRIAGGVRLF